MRYDGGEAATIDGQALRALRQSKRLTQDELSRRARVDQTSISRIERNYRRPTRRTLRALLRVLLDME